jgi:hypothetical protein
MSITVETEKIILDYVQKIIPNVECRRAYYPLLSPEELADAGKPVLLIFPVERLAEKFNQGGTRKNNFVIGITLNAKLQNVNDEPEKLVEEIDGLFSGIETIHDSFLKKVVIPKESGNFRIACDQPNHQVLIDKDMWDQNCFSSLIYISVEVFDDRDKNKNEKQN